MSDATPDTLRARNRLAHEKSPYLQQHQYNPVDWYPWGAEAFQRARDARLPIFLSIGYSTCHWCHVMERESFEDEATAAYLNAHFVCIKVDREERPDVDKIYMTFLQATSRGGGWPLNAFLTPDLKPFFAGTYWPPVPRQGRASFGQVLAQISETWVERPDEVSGSAASIHSRLSELTARTGVDAQAISPQALLAAGLSLKEGYDAVHGGWGNAPKFPLPTHPALLLRHGVRTGDDEAVRMVLHTAGRMAAGGINDQLGGGFARYSVDAHWLVPHFEKMLYDNAQLVSLYLECYLVSGEEAYAEVARDILRYVLGDMRHPAGGFYSAEDADSEGKEGKFYCWTLVELESLLTPAELALAVSCLGVTAEGNFRDHSDPDPLPGQNVLHLATATRDAAQALALRALKNKLLLARTSRVRPQRDDKILTSWNGLMLGAVARAAVVLDDPAYLEAAERNYSFLIEQLWDAATETLYHRWRDDSHDTTQLLEDYACLLHGVLELYQVTLDEAKLTFAIRLAHAMLARFYDAQAGGFWQSAADASDLILRLKDDYDGAEPSGNSMATRALLTLAVITDDPAWRAAADKTLRLFAAQMSHMPRAMTSMWLAADFALASPLRLVLAGTAESSGPLLAAAHRVFLPNLVVLGTSGPVDSFAAGLPAVDGRATGYLCQGSACQPPTQDAGTLRQILLRAAYGDLEE